MRILAIGNCPLDRFLGSGKTRIEWSSGFRKRGHLVTTVDTKYLSKLIPKWMGSRLGLTIAARRFIASINPLDYDIIEFFGGEFWWATRYLGQQVHRPMIIAHTDGLELLAHERLTAAGVLETGRLERWLPFLDLHQLERQAFTYADRFVTGCQLDLEYVLNHGIFNSKDAVVVPVGIEGEYLARIFHQERENKIVYFGSWTKRKGLNHLVDVTTEILRQHPNWNFLILGAFNQVTDIKDIYPADVWPQIEIAPKLEITEVAHQLDRCKILFFPSEYEGFGMAIAEAMGCGCTAVVTPTGFGGDLENERNALICNFGDQDAMKIALNRLIENEELRERIGRSGYDSVQHLYWSKSVDRLEEIYTNWLQEWEVNQ